MPRHEFQPGKLVVGFFLTLTGVVYLGDAGDAWETPWFAVIPLVVAGLGLAGAVAFLNHAIRGRRTSGRASPTSPAGPTASAGWAGWAGAADQAGPARRAGQAADGRGDEPGKRR
ncbi:hypothetical protein [Streptomyces adelaidensis]|uniref:hypothetical protein n=1 Tax=Streptomyces adelaidensis TaxID=2796465 RepID=UPI0019078A7B|nr:hypothetical protein [Streptomyces adelaidensis]